MERELIYHYDSKKQLIPIFLIELLTWLFAFVIMNNIFKIKNLVIIIVVMIVLLIGGIIYFMKKVKEEKQRPPYLVCNNQGIFSKEFLEKPIYWKDVEGFEMIRINKYMAIGIKSKVQNEFTAKMNNGDYYLIPCANSKEKPRYIVEDLEIYKSKIDNKQVKQ